MKPVLNTSWSSVVCTVTAQPGRLRLLPLVLTGLLVWLGALWPAQAEELCAYTARISAQDKTNTLGRSILATVSKQSVVAAIRMDRSNYYTHNRRDPQDEPDCLFASLVQRKRLDDMAAKSRIPQSVISTVARTEPVLRIRVFADRLEVQTLSASAATAAAPITTGRARPVPVPEDPVESGPAGAAPVVPTPAPASVVAPVPLAAASGPVSSHARTRDAMVRLAQDMPAQTSLVRWVGLAQYAECAVMLGDIEDKLATGQYTLTARQWESYPVLAAMLQYTRPRLLTDASAAAALEQALEAVRVRTRARGTQSAYDECFKATRPIYEALSSGR